MADVSVLSDPDLLTDVHEVPAAGGDVLEDEGGDNIVSGDALLDAGSAGDPDRDAAADAESDSGSSGLEGSDASGSEEASSDLDSVSDPDEEDDQAFQPEYYISDGILYSSDGVALDRDIYILPASVTATNAVYTPTAWQLNLAQHRAFGEHYLMWAERVSYSNTYYWRYYLVIGRDMRYSANVYTYVNAEVYTYYSYGSSVTYDVSVSSGSVNGSSYLVYSDLYFDYVGVDPAGSGLTLVFIVFFMFVMLFAILMGGKRHV